jgi:hypothetical protein
VSYAVATEGLRRSEQQRRRVSTEFARRIPRRSRDVQDLFDEIEQPWGIDRLEKDVPGAGRPYFLVYIAVSISGDEHGHHAWLQPPGVLGEDHAIHVRHPQVQQG